MKDRKLKEPKGEGKVPKKDMKEAVKKVAEAKNDKDNNSVRPKTGKADGKSRKKYLIRAPNQA